MSDSTPQFGKAEYSTVPGTEHCAVCQQLIGASYYRVNGKMACASCAERIQLGQPVEAGSSYMKALLYGLGAAFVGFVLYSAVGILTGLEIGYVSLAVGFLVGVAMKKGAGGVGGRKYQITAALLVYAAVSMSAIPIYIHQISEKNAGSAPVSQTQAAPATGAANDSTQAPDATPASQPQKPKMNFVAAIGVLVLLGLASPFLELASPVSGLIGLFILFIGIQFAWKQTAATALAVDGPYENGPPKSVSASIGT